MKEVMVLTGYAQDADLSGNVVNVLVFNKGELRLEVPTSTIKSLIEALANKHDDGQDDPPYLSEVEEIGGISEDEVGDEWGIGQV